VSALGRYTVVPPIAPKIAGTLLAGCYLATLAYAGHAAAGQGGDRYVRIGADAAHLLAAGAWLGAYALPQVILVAALAAIGSLHIAPANSQVAVAAAGQQAPPGARSLTLALTGDSIITMKLSVHTDPAFVKMIELVRGADAAFTNLEMLFHDYEPFPSTESGGTYMRADPALARELVWAGFDLVARANNHTHDYGVEGARLTTKYVAEAGLVQAGVGESLREAREARYLDTDKGRVALVSTAERVPTTVNGNARRADACRCTSWACTAA